MKLIQQGAEAKIFLDKSKITKDRIPKSYRHPTLDHQIRTRRTKSEAKILTKAREAGINVPALIHTTKHALTIEYIDGDRLSDTLNDYPKTKQLSTMQKLGTQVAKLHANNIIHSDLTTSNTILAKKKRGLGEKLKGIKKLNLPEGEYAIFGSGPMAIRNIRKSDDIDLIVKKELWEKLKKKHKEEVHKIEGRQVHLIRIGGIEIYDKWEVWIKNIVPIIEDAEIINGLPFVKLEHVIKWEKAYGRKKDTEDIRLIEKYLANPGEIFLIDFGLSYISTKIEDKAVDLHLIKQALEAKHFQNHEDLFKAFLKGYKWEETNKVVERLVVVEKRGRYKH